jgi:general secretion pathway protein C
MILNPQSMWAPRLAAFLLAALAAASAVYWVLKWSGQGNETAVAALPVAEAPAIDPQSLARALGGGQIVQATPATPVVANAASRLALLGVVATARQGGTALIAVDGKPARPYRVGATVEDGLVLQSVGPRRAQLAARMDGPATLTLELPILSKK